MSKLVQYEVTVKIQVTVEDGALDMTGDQWAKKIAKDYSEMALTYRSIGADKIISTSIKELK